MKDWLDGEYIELENEIGVPKAEIHLAIQGSINLIPFDSGLFRPASDFERILTPSCFAYR